VTRFSTHTLFSNYKTTPTQHFSNYTSILSTLLTNKQCANKGGFFFLFLLFSLSPHYPNNLLPSMDTLLGNMADSCWDRRGPVSPHLFEWGPIGGTGAARGRDREPQQNTPRPRPFSGAGRGIGLGARIFGGPGGPVTNATNNRLKSIPTDISLR